MASAGPAASLGAQGQRLVTGSAPLAATSSPGHRGLGRGRVAGANEYQTA